MVHVRNFFFKFFYFRPKRSYIESIYFWFSLSFLIWRILLVLLNASKIHDASKRPVDIIRSIPQEYYHKEVCYLEFLLKLEKKNIFHSEWCLGKTIFRTNSKFWNFIDWYAILPFDEKIVVVGNVNWPSKCLSLGITNSFYR